MNRVKYIEQELAKKRGRNIDEEDQVENELKRAEDELYTIPDHLKVSNFFPFLLQWSQFFCSMFIFYFLAAAQFRLTFGL